MLRLTDGSNENWAGIPFGEVELAFTRVEDYRAPQWPGSEHPNSSTSTSRSTTSRPVSHREAPQEPR